MKTEEKDAAFAVIKAAAADLGVKPLDLGSQAQLVGYLAGQLVETHKLLQQMLDVAENADETGYVADVGFVDLDKLHAKVRDAIGVVPTTPVDPDPMMRPEVLRAYQTQPEQRDCKD